jgi:hypothetical protein
MPETYRVTLTDGRTFNVTTEGGPPSEADVMASLSNDSPAVGAHPEAVMRAPTTADPVTLGEVIDNPQEAIGRIGAILKRDVTDPKLWVSAAVAYFGPKVLTSRPVLNAVHTASRVRMSPGVSMKAGASGLTLKPTFGFHLKPDATAAPAPAAPSVPSAPVEPMPVQPGPARPPIQVQEPPVAAPAAAVEPPSGMNTPTQPPSIAGLIQRREAEVRSGALAGGTPPAVPIPQGVAMKAAVEAFKAAKVMPQPAEVSWVTYYIQQGATPEAAVSKVVAMRPAQPANPAAALAQGLGTPTDAEVAQVVAAKNARTTRAKGGTK